MAFSLFIGFGCQVTLIDVADSGLAFRFMGGRTERSVENKYNFEINNK